MVQALKLKTLWRKSTDRQWSVIILKLTVHTWLQQTIQAKQVSAHATHGHTHTYTYSHTLTHTFYTHTFTHRTLYMAVSHYH